MRSLLLRGLLLAGIALLPSCVTTQVSPEVADNAMKEVSGSWTFSHFGPATASSSEIPNPASHVRQHFRDARINIKPDGTGSMLMVGQAQSFRTSITESADTFHKLSYKSGMFGTESLVYDRSHKTLMMSTKLKLPGKKGVLPTYFRKAPE